MNASAASHLFGRHFFLPGLAWWAGVLLTVALASHLLIGPALAQQGAQARGVPTAQGPWNGWSDLAFVSPTEGWAVGYAEPCATSLASSCVPLLKHYLHGVWSSVSLPFSGWLTTISMLSARDGWAGGPDMLLHYDGVTWQHVANEQHLSFLQLQMLSDTDGWAITSGATGSIAISHYDGQTWQPQGLPTITHQGTRYDLLPQALAMVSPTEGWATAMIVRSVGSSTTLAAPQTYEGAVILQYRAGRWSLAAQIPQGDLSAISMASATEGWAMGNTEDTQPATPTPAVHQTPLLLHYSRGRWQRVANPVTNPVVCCLSTVTIRTASDGWAAGPESGLEPRPLATMMHYTRGRWTGVPMPTRGSAKATITRMVMTSASDGWAVGSLNSMSIDHPDFTTPLMLRYHQGAWSLIDD